MKTKHSLCFANFIRNNRTEVPGSILASFPDVSDSTDYKFWEEEDFSYSKRIPSIFSPWALCRTRSSSVQVRT